MKKGEIVRVKISGINIRGKSFGYIDDEKVEVNINAAKDQIVEGTVSKTRKRKIELIRCKIVDYANRNNAIYPEKLKEQCGGCNYQYYTYNEQLELKDKMIKELLDNAISYDYIYDKPVENVSKINYRNKMEFSFGNAVKDGPMILGLHKQNSFHDIVTVEDNNLMPEEFNRVYKFSNEFFSNTEFTFYHKITKIGYFRYLVLRKSEANKQVLVNLITTSQICPSSENKMLEEYTKKLLELDLGEYNISGILHTVNDKLSDTVDSEKETILYGKLDITEKIFDLDFNISPYSFFQTNSKTVSKLYEKVLEYLDGIEENVVFDLFSGTGTIAQIISKKFKKVYAIELVEEAVKKAKENAKLNNINNIEFIAGDVFEKLDILEEKPNILVLDPPRMGVLTKTIEKLVKYNTKTIVYVSCNPVTLVKDLKDFEEYGYKVKRAGIVDMFSFTNHVECVVLMSRK